MIDANSSSEPTKPPAPRTVAAVPNRSGKNVVQPLDMCVVRHLVGSLVVMFAARPSPTPPAMAPPIMMSGLYAAIDMLVSLGHADRPDSGAVPTWFDVGW